MTTPTSSSNSNTLLWVLAALVLVALVFCVRHTLLVIQTDIQQRSQVEVAASELNLVGGDVVTDGSAVTLSGELPSATNKASLLSRVTNLQGVDRVIDNLTVKPLPEGALSFSRDGDNVRFRAALGDANQRQAFSQLLLSQYNAEAASNEIIESRPTPWYGAVAELIGSSNGVDPFNIEFDKNTFRISGLAATDDDRDRLLSLIGEKVDTTVEVTSELKVLPRLSLSVNMEGLELMGRLNDQAAIRSKIDAIYTQLPDGIDTTDLSFAPHYAQSKWLDKALDFIQNEAIPENIEANFSSRSIALFGTVDSEQRKATISDAAIRAFGESHIIDNQLQVISPPATLIVTGNADRVTLEGVLVSEAQLDETLDQAMSMFDDRTVVSQLEVGAGAGHGTWILEGLKLLSLLPPQSQFRLDGNPSQIDISAQVSSPEQKLALEQRITSENIMTPLQSSIRYDEAAYMQQLALERQAIAQAIAAQTAREQAATESRAKVAAQVAQAESKDTTATEAVNALAGLDLQGIQFELSSAGIKPESISVLEQVIAVLKRYPTLSILISGHTDSTGSDDLNLSVSSARAESVRSFLIERGIPATQLEARGFGETRPKVSNDTLVNRRINRRIEFKVVE